ncbi:MAG TPA: glycerophosphodiester phosphodiesterase family protein, partial [Geodermatophilus sp.]|nr:glycerophosphodiester phosphodiesterase family protein [Geodermatophilus sp.]
ALTGLSDLVPAAHRAGLAVYVWTLRPENAFLPRHLRRGQDPAAPGDAESEARLLLALGVDGLITDCPDVAVRAREALRPERPRAGSPGPRRSAHSSRSWTTTFSSRPGPTPMTLIRAPASSSIRRT